MASRNVDVGNTSGENKKPLNAEGGHGYINMMSTENVVMRAKYYGSSQPDLGK